MGDIFVEGSVMDMSTDELLGSIYRLYLECLYNLLLGGGLGVDEIVKLGKVIMPIGGYINSNIERSSSSGVGGSNNLLKVIGG